MSICYHEGVPGHHLQIAQVRYLADALTRYQRTLAGTSGHAEGWALYAERLMGELGYLDDPAYELGMLRAQAMRAVRVVVDIGMHLELAIPADERYHPGETWTPELALPFVIERSKFPADFMAQRGRPLPRPARSGDQLQGRRAGVARRRATTPQRAPATPSTSRTSTATRSTSARWASPSSSASWRGSDVELADTSSTSVGAMVVPLCARVTAPERAIGRACGMQQHPCANAERATLTRRLVRLRRAAAARVL